MLNGETNMLKDIIKKAKEKGKKVNVYSHQFPDGDAVCSSCAVIEYLKSKGVEAKYITNNLSLQYTKIFGEIQTSTKVNENDISIILDTRTTNYAENQMFSRSATDDTYVIDHHPKKDGEICIEDELGISNTNFLRDANASSVCEILVNEIRTRFKPDNW